jgi:hypothetical protein
MTDQNLPDLNPVSPPKVPTSVQNSTAKVPEAAKTDAPPKPREIGGPKGPEPTRYGDWEVGGRCTDF